MKLRTSLGGKGKEQSTEPFMTKGINVFTLVSIQFNEIELMSNIVTNQNDSLPPNKYFNRRYSMGMINNCLDMHEALKKSKKTECCFMEYDN